MASEKKKCFSYFGRELDTETHWEKYGPFGFNSESPRETCF